MTVLSTPCAYDQKAVPESEAYECCGETCAASAITDLRQVTSPQAVLDWLRTQYGEGGVSGGTNVSEIVAALNHWGVPAHAVSAPIRQAVAGALARGHRYFAAVYSDHQANRTHREEFYDWYDGVNELGPVRAALAEWELIFNELRPHGSLGLLTPVEFLEQNFPSPEGVQV